MFERHGATEESVESVGGRAAPPALREVLGASYAIEREIGRGGMVTVYLARDLRHGRPVAVKVLRPELAAELGAERFLREVATTAALQHPHILTLHDSGGAGGLLYYVMPYVEGESLRARLERERQLPVEAAVRIATQVALALDYAHRHGVVHRDVKPENVLLDEDGHALVADFGIARAVQKAADTATLTRSGVALGTPQYMSPEQATAEREVDARTDVWALGCLLYEMLAGEPPFTGPTVPAIVGRVMTERPRPLAALRDTVPPHVEAAALTALAKLPADRFPTAAAFAAALAEPGAGRVGTPPGTDAASARGVRRPMPRRRAAVLATAALLAAVALGWAVGRVRARASAAASGSVTERGPVRFVIDVDSGSLGSGNWWRSAPAISPDGRAVVYAATGPAGGRLYVRRADDVVARPLAGTEGGDWPFFSPDGRWVGFTSRDAIRKVRLDGGTPVLVTTLPPSETYLGGAWGPDDTIIYTTFARGGLYRVPAGGGTPSRIAVADTMRQVLHPHRLPGKRALLVTASRDWRVGRVAVLDLETGRVHRFGPGTGARYVAGHIVYAGASGQLYQQPFDLERLAPSGPAEEIASGLDASFAVYSPFDASPTGALVYRVSTGGAKLTLLDRDGREQQVLPGLVPWSPRFSPDGRSIAYAAVPGQEGGDVWNNETWQNDIWIAELETGRVRRLTTDGNDNNEPQWSPGGDSIAFDAGLLGTKDIFVQGVDGGSARLLLRRPGSQHPSDWAPDGAVVFSEGDIWLQPSDGGMARRYAATPAREDRPRVSRDGRWVAYSSDESGRDEVYLQPYPTPGRTRLVSAGGGVAPAWRRDGRELYYWQGDQLIAVSLDPGGAGEPPVVRRRTPLFRVAREAGAGYDASPDGLRFAIATTGPRASRLMVALDAVGDARSRSAPRR